MSSWVVAMGLVWIGCDIVVVAFFVGMGILEKRATRRQAGNLLPASGIDTPRARPIVRHNEPAILSGPYALRVLARP